MFTMPSENNTSKYWYVMFIHILLNGISWLAVHLVYESYVSMCFCILWVDRLKVFVPHAVCRKTFLTVPSSRRNRRRVLH